MNIDQISKLNRYPAIYFYLKSFKGGENSIKDKGIQTIAIVIVVVVAAAVVAGGYMVMSGDGGEETPEEPEETEETGGEETEETVGEGYEVVSSFEPPDVSPSGLAWDGEYLWNADSDKWTVGYKIYKLDPSTEM